MIMKYKDFKTMSQNEMKKILGGSEEEETGQGTCRSHCNQGGIILVSDCKTKAEAQAASTGCNEYWGAGHGGWCCSSCASAGWGACS